MDEREWPITHQNMSKESSNVAAHVAATKPERSLISIFQKYSLNRSKLSTKHSIILKTNVRKTKIVKKKIKLCQKTFKVSQNRVNKLTCLLLGGFL